MTQDQGPAPNNSPSRLHIFPTRLSQPNREPFLGGQRLRSAQRPLVPRRTKSLTSACCTTTLGEGSVASDKPEHVILRLDNATSENTAHTPFSPDQPEINTLLFVQTMDDIDVSQFDGFPQHFQEVMEFRFSLNSETDRGCALMVASFLDHKLGKLLEAMFVDDSKVVSELFSHSGTLGTFSSRIDTAYALGLIGPNTRRDINLIRKIRNEFGHSHYTLKFTDDRIRSRCKELFHFNNIESTDDPRKMFVKTAISILALINSDLRRTEHRTVAKDLYLDATERKNIRNAFRCLPHRSMRKRKTR